MRDRIVNQHNPGIALYPRSLSYDLLPLIGSPGWALLRALHDHADEQAHLYRGSRPIAPSSEEMQALAGVGEASLQIIKELLRICGCLSWEEVRGKQAARPGRKLKQAPTRSFVYYLHPLTGLTVTTGLVQRVLEYALGSDRAQAYLKANGLLRARPAFLPTSAWPPLTLWLVDNPSWQELYQRAHGSGAHRGYRGEVTRWLEGAAEVVATLECEQLPSSDAQSTIAGRAVMVMARWQLTTTVPSWGGHGPLVQNHGDSPMPPHTPLNELTNQSTNQGIGSLRGRGGKRTEEGKKEKETKGRNRDPHAKYDQPVRTSTQAHLQADAGADLLAQAEAALWAAVPGLLDAAEAGPGKDLFSHLDGADVLYQPSRSEQRQARRLLHDHPVDTVVAALRAAVSCYRPAPGQPAGISRFGFAVGLPAFQAALPAPPDASGATLCTAPEDIPGDVDYAQDFWHDYERVNGRGVTRAERRRIEAVAAQASWLQLLVWLDRWEQAHARDEMELNAGYFESCSAAEASTVNGPLGPSRQQPLRSTPAIQPQVDEPLVLPPEYDRVLARLRELGIRRAEALAKHAGTTLALVDAWWAASERQGVKNRHAYTAAGIATGKMPELIPARRVSAVEPAYEANVLPLLSVCADDAYGTVWRRVQATLAQQISSEAYTTWIAALRLLDVIGKAAIVAAPNVFVRNEVRERFETMIADVLAHELGQRLEIEVVIDSSR